MFEVDAGNSILFVGANGSGKTRLAAKIEEELGSTAHRISAHRALALNPNVPKISERIALFGLRYGLPRDNAQPEHREGQRWKSRNATHLLDDFDFVVQSLFAEQSNRALRSHKGARAGEIAPPEPTKFERLTEIWESILPHRKLIITGDDIQVTVADTPWVYSASELSDGERSVFYLLGQALLAQDNSVLIIDEPELHIHRAVMSALWDAIESARPDCAFIFITHDLDFASSRPGQKFVVREYSGRREWTIDPITEDAAFDEETTTLILGSRRPALFVEGANSSLDRAIYRHAYPEHTIISCGSCQSVIQSVRAMRVT